MDEEGEYMRDSTGRCSFWKQRGSVERLYTADRDNNEPTGSSDGPSVQLSTDGRKLPSRIRTESSGSDSSSTEEIVDMEEGSDGSLCGRRLSRSEERPSAMEDMDSYVSFRMARIKFDTSSEVIPPSEGLYSDCYILVHHHLMEGCSNHPSSLVRCPFVSKFCY